MSNIVSGMMRSLALSYFRLSSYAYRMDVSKSIILLAANAWIQFLTRAIDSLSSCETTYDKISIENQFDKFDQKKNGQLTVKSCSNPPVVLELSVAWIQINPLFPSMIETPQGRLWKCVFHLLTNDGNTFIKMPWPN